ncbi:MAG: hypothetical protein ACP5Q4_08345 [Candidatus Caldatribacteriaceae bacterium]
MPERVIRNEDVEELVVEIPENHKHLRASVILTDGTRLIFQEATIANLVRAYIVIKTHPTHTRIVLTGQKVLVRKEGYAEWQLLED